MNIREAIEARHTVRKYRKVQIAAVDIMEMNFKIDEVNREHGLHIRMLTNVNVPVNRLMKLFMAKGLRNYIILSGPDVRSVKEKLGYAGAKLMIYAQTIGLNTWWVGGSYNQRRVAQLAEGQVVAGIIVIGYGQSQGRPHRSRPAHEVCSYAGKMPAWFEAGVKLSLLAPTPYNRQNFLITGKDHHVDIYCDDARWGDIVKGIIRYHFEAGARFVMALPMTCPST